MSAGHTAAQHLISSPLQVSSAAKAVGWRSPSTAAGLGGASPNKLPPVPLRNRLIASSDRKHTEEDGSITPSHLEDLILWLLLLLLADAIRTDE